MLTSLGDWKTTKKPQEGRSSLQGTSKEELVAAEERTLSAAVARCEQARP